ncbi:MAG: YaeQ family protein, partial [uncultured bacterium]
DLWRKNNQDTFARKTNLTVIQLPFESTQAMAAMAKRNMDLVCNIEDGQIFLMCDETTLNIEPVVLLQSK